MKFEIIDHGIDRADYFRGCGTAYTGYDQVVTGIGDDFLSALDDALESVAQSDSGVDIEKLERMIAEEAGITEKPGIRYNKRTAHVNPDAEDTFYYVSIRWSV